MCIFICFVNELSNIRNDLDYLVFGIIFLPTHPVSNKKRREILLIKEIAGAKYIAEFD